MSLVEKEVTPGGPWEEVVGWLPTPLSPSATGRVVVAFMALVSKAPGDVLFSSAVTPGRPAALTALLLAYPRLGKDSYAAVCIGRRCILGGKYVFVTLFLDHVEKGSPSQAEFILHPQSFWEVRPRCGGRGSAGL